MTIPAQSREIEQLYHQMTLGDRRVIAITAANPGEGVTSVAIALAERYLLAGETTLLVDLNLARPALQSHLSIGETGAIVTDALTSLLPVPQLVTVAEQMLSIIGVTAPQQREQVIKLRTPGILEQCIEQWQQQFKRIIFDSPAINPLSVNDIPAERIAAAAGGAILVVLAGQTTEIMVSAAQQKLTAVQVPLLGCLLNDRDNAPLKSELRREVKRLPRCFNRLALRLDQWLAGHHFLSLEI